MSADDEREKTGATIHTVAKTTVDAVTKEAMADIVQAINRATEWISQAVENELISKCLDPNEGVAFHNATDWTTHAVLVDLIAHAADDAMQSGTSTTLEIHEHIRIPKTFPPPSPPSTNLSPVLATHSDNNRLGLSKPNFMHPRCYRLALENEIEQKSGGLVRLSIAPAISASVDASPTKLSPSRHMSRGHGHSHKGGHGGILPNKRSGYCQRCVFEGRSCKINDCLKHQVLK
ncbi:uncharacterized protein PITG_21043 [Phytophthora infestans T30-4]|uniref:Uncharacterized protein n=1 Tax=Phytophthora infestans (strain T30-4) TaxID=403677 RepID=D0P314_PHYIT|nr:uncharacterized protein PITG_21043 [Phytophthora infestans T30-4]EEY58780.1 conserved hypothetical protein [Phytophthora infestans T30-4]|eukprot:XP_002895310.1 conserved hypothetical protein [Phytophthora infestans T30-4]